MEPKSDVPKLPDMVMCGDHPSFTKTELNMKEKLEDKDRKPISQSRISPTTSRTERDRTVAAARGGQTCSAAGTGDSRLRATSEHALRLIEARKRVRSLEAVPRGDDIAAGNRALIQAALGSFRWPPYLLAVWVVVLVMTHTLHCLVSMLDRALPNLKRFSQYFRAWTEEAWRTGSEREVSHRLFPLVLATITACLYALYCVLYALHAVALWAVEPLASDLEDKSSEVDAKVTDYDDLTAVIKH